MKTLRGAIAAVVFILLVWWAASVALDKAFLPTPWDAFRSFGESLASGALSRHFLISAYRVVVSIVIAVILAVPIGILIGRHPGADRIAAPLLYILYPIPKIVFLPIIVVILGLGNAPKIFMIALVVFFQTLVVVRDSAKALPESRMQDLRLLGASRLQTFRHLILPCCLPGILTSLRVTLGTAIAILFFAETFASFDGLGYLILNAMQSRDYPLMYAGILAMALLGVILYALLDFGEKRFCRWKRYE